ncbi:replicative DNA helicase [Mesomycoplasma ovipneumoniae]|uniref:replicative DNA helicase n=1 Tax=Mesomycoplasma ovipneumoniae TaxID=29562 RepID=UPI0026E35023|nr:replicative DNA helicase [Mesomycoplasma ovipneumoniae]MDO6856464.1 replicative DNA helicase [Mesomycoplasma ovipneumoniae]
MNNSRYTSPDIESFVVSFLLSNPKKIIDYIDIIRIENFSDPRLAEVVKAIKSVSTNNPEPEVNLIVEELAKNQKLEKIGGKSFIIWLYNNNFSLPSEIKQHLEIIAEKQKLRELKKIVIESTQNLDKSNQNASTISNELVEKISALESSYQVQTFSNIHDIATEVFQFLTELRTSRTAIKGTSTGYDNLDAVTSGFQKGDLIVLAARPSVGKTAFALNLAWNVCKSQKSVLFFSLEMPKNDLGMRLLSLISRIPGNKFKTPKNLTPEDLKIIQTVILNRLKNIKLKINDSGSINIDEIVNEVIKRHRNNEAFDLIIIDYLQLINSQTKNQYYNRTVEVSMISRKLKQLARAVNTPIIALAQLSRNVEKREDKIPMLSDLRESGAIEQDADIVLFLHREDYYNKTESSDTNGSITNLIIAKHRNGAVGKLLFHFMPAAGSFIEVKHK